MFCYIARPSSGSGVALGASHVVLLKTEPFLISLLIRGRGGKSGSLNICEASDKEGDCLSQSGKEG